MQLYLHLFEHQVDILVILCFYNIEQLDYVLMLELLKEHDLSICSLSISGMLERIEYFFDCNDFFGTTINGFPDMTISSFAIFLDDFVSVQDVGLYFLSHFYYNS